MVSPRYLAFNSRLLLKLLSVIFLRPVRLKIDTARQPLPVGTA